MNRYDGRLAVGRAGRSSPMSTAACFTVGTAGSTVPWRNLMMDGAGFGGTSRAFGLASPTPRTGASGVVRNHHPDTRVPLLGRATPARRLPPSNLTTPPPRRGRHAADSYAPYRSPEPRSPTEALWAIATALERLADFIAAASA